MLLPLMNLDPRLVVAIVFAFGLLFGSFFNVVIFRLPAEESIVWPGSHCPKCNHTLSAWENLPVVSWILLRARCLGCKAPISWRYPAIELLTACLWAAVVWVFGPTLQAAFLLVLVSLMIVIFWIDFDTQYIYDQTTFPGVVIGLAYSYFVTHQFWLALAAALYAAAAVSLVYGLSWLVFREEGIGGGDLTLVAMLGAWLGLKAMILALGLGVLIGAVMGMGMVFAGYVRERFWPPVGLALITGVTFYGCCSFLLASTPAGLGGVTSQQLKGALALFAALVGTSIGYFYTRATRDKDTEKPRIPFGPALVLGGLAALFWGDAMLAWYTNQMGTFLS